jgi:ribosomal protein L11
MGRIPRVSFAIVFASPVVSGGSACAVKPVEHATEQCAVIGGETLPAGVTPGAICDAIRAATKSTAPGIAYSIEVRVRSASSLSAIVTLPNGTTLPEQNLATSDRQLNAGAIQRYATSIAAEIARTTTG